MNQSVEHQVQILKMTHSLRDNLTGVLTDEDLRFQPGGDNMTLGALCREAGEIEYAYIQSLKTFTQNFDYKHSDTEVERSVEKLKAWYATLDEEFYTLVGGFSQEDLQKIINRGVGFEVPVDVQLAIYREALMLFYGKASVFLRTMRKPMPPEWQDWIA